MIDLINFFDEKFNKGELNFPYAYYSSNSFFKFSDHPFRLIEGDKIVMYFFSAQGIADFFDRVLKSVMRHVNKDSFFKSKRKGITRYFKIIKVTDEQLAKEKSDGDIFSYRVEEMQKLRKYSSEVAAYYKKLCVCGGVIISRTITYSKECTCSTCENWSGCGRGDSEIRYFCSGCGKVYLCHDYNGYYDSHKYYEY